MTLEIRPIASRDNPQVRQLVIDTLSEFGCVGEGFAYADPELARMYETYQTPGNAYWVVVKPKTEGNTEQVLGGCGYARLKGTRPNEAVCELQKLYFRPELRGRGFGRKLLSLCLGAAAASGYRTIYIETVPQMQEAVGLYEKFGFRPIDAAMGETGHFNCTVFMRLDFERVPTQKGPMLSAVDEGRLHG